MTKVGGIITGHDWSNLDQVLTLQPVTTRVRDTGSCKKAAAPFSQKSGVQWRKRVGSRNSAFLEQKKEELLGKTDD